MDMPFDCNNVFQYNVFMHQRLQKVTIYQEICGNLRKIRFNVTTIRWKHLATNMVQWFIGAARSRTCQSSQFKPIVANLHRISFARTDLLGFRVELPFLLIKKNNIDYSVFIDVEVDILINCSMSVVLICLLITGVMWNNYDNAYTKVVLVYLVTTRSYKKIDCVTFPCFLVGVDSLMPFYT